MRNTTKTAAEEKFKALQKKQKRRLSEVEKAQEERAEHIAELRAKRLAKEAEDLANAPAPKTKPKKKS